MMICDATYMQVVSMLLTGAIGAAGTISELGKNGNHYALWPAICGLVQTFCDYVGGALISCLIAVVLSLLYLMYSIYEVTKPQSSSSPPP
jgi:uncharacterized protein (TIGR01569 family)